MPQPLNKRLNVSVNELKEFIILKNHEEGLTQKKISEILGCDQHTIVKWMKKLNINVKIHKWFDKNTTNGNKECISCKKILNISNFRNGRNDCLTCEKQYRKKYYDKNREKLLSINEKYRIENRNKERTRYKEYDTKNREKRRVAERERYDNDESFKLRKNLRSRLYNHFYVQGVSKSKTSCEYGVDYNKIIQHLGPKPSSDHTIDHIIPLSLFDFSNKVHIQAAFLPENHQWLLGSENFRKGNKLLNNTLIKNTLKIVNDFILSNGCKEIIK